MASSKKYYLQARRAGCGCTVRQGEAACASESQRETGALLLYQSIMEELTLEADLLALSSAIIPRRTKSSP